MLCSSSTPSILKNAIDIIESFAIAFAFGAVNHTSFQIRTCAVCSLDVAGVARKSFNVTGKLLEVSIFINRPCGLLSFRGVRVSSVSRVTMRDIKTNRESIIWQIRIWYITFFETFSLKIIIVLLFADDIHFYWCSHYIHTNQWFCINCNCYGWSMALENCMPYTNRQTLL